MNYIKKKAKVKGKPVDDSFALIETEEAELEYIGQGIKEKTCSCCGKVIATIHWQLWHYKMQKNGKTIHQCSYTCNRKEFKSKPKPKWKRADTAYV